MSRFSKQLWEMRARAAWARLRALVPVFRSPYRVAPPAPSDRRQATRPLPVAERQLQRGASFWRAVFGAQLRRWVGWALVGLMSVVLLIQVSMLTTRAYAVYDLEAARARLVRERRDLVLQLGAAQPLDGLAEAAAGAGLQPTTPEQWTIVTLPSAEAQP